MPARINYLTDYFIDGIIIIEFNESESSFLACLFLGDNINVNNIAELLEVIFKIILLNVFFKTSKEYFFYCRLSFWFTRILGKYWN